MIVYLGITSFCNLQCTYCYREFNCPCDQTQHKRLPLSMAVKLIDLLRNDFPRRQVRFVFHGHEPLASGYDYFKRLFDILNCSDFNPRFYLRTNGTLLNARLTKLLRTYHVRVGIAIDGPDFIHDAVRKYPSGRQSLYRIIRNMQHLREEGIEPTAFCVYTKKSLGYERAIYEFFKSERLNFVFAPVAKVAQVDAHGFGLTASEAAEFHNHLFDLYFFDRGKTITIQRIDKLIAAILDSSKKFVRKACFEGALFLDYDGQIYRCAGFAGNRKYSIGNMENIESLVRLLSSRAAIEQKEKFSQVFTGCKKCELDRICPGGCYYNAFMEGTAPDDSWFCDFFRIVALHTIERVYSSMAFENTCLNTEGKLITVQ